MSFIGFDGKGYQSFVAKSDDLVNWGDMRLAMGYGPEGSFDHGGVVIGAYLYESYDIKALRTLKKKDGKYWTLYGAYPRQGGAHVMVAFSRDPYQWTVDPDPIYKAGGNPSGLDRKYAHKISLVWNPANESYYMFYCAVGDNGRGIGLITSKPL